MRPQEACTASDQVESTPVRLLDSSGGGGGLASSLGGQLLARGLASGGLAGCLLGAGHGCLLALLLLITR